MTVLGFGTANAEVGLDLSGFASFGAGQVSRDDLTFMDYDGDWSFDSDTMLGLQGIVSLAERVSLTGQLVSRGFSTDDTYDTYVPEVEWFFLSYELTQDARVRAGRLRTPHYLFSESLEVGYSYPWVRPPVDMYVLFLEPFSHFDGADVSYQLALGGIDTELKLFGGQMSGEFMGIDIDVARVVGATATFRQDDVTVRYGVNTNKTSLALPGGEILVNGFDMAAAAVPSVFSGISENFYNDKQEYQYHGFGIHWEPGDWSLMAERFLFIGPNDHFSLDSRGWYVSIGRQFGDWMPYTVVGDYRTRIDSRILYQIRDTYQAVPAGQNAMLDQLRGGALFALEERNIAQRSNTLGVRWDFHPQADVKFELQYFDFLTASTGHMLPDDIFNKPSNAVLTTIVMDVVF